MIYDSLESGKLREMMETLRNEKEALLVDLTGAAYANDTLKYQLASLQRKLELAIKYTENQASKIKKMDDILDAVMTALVVHDRERSVFVLRMIDELRGNLVSLEDHERSS